MTTMGNSTVTRSGAVLLALLLAIGTSTASAAIVKNFEFNSNGVLPSDDSEIVFTATAGVVEADVFSVAGGMLSGHYVGGNSYPITYAYPNASNGYPTNGGISPSDPWLVEIRARVQENRGGTFTLYNGNRRFSISFTATGVRVIRSQAVAYVDHACDTTQWHVLRMWSDNGSTFSASVDGVVFAENQNGVNDANIKNGFFIRLNPHSEAAQVQWDYVRFESGENAVAVEGVSFGEIKALYR